MFTCHTEPGTAIGAHLATCPCPPYVPPSRSCSSLLMCVFLGASSSLSMRPCSPLRPLDWGIICTDQGQTCRSQTYPVLPGSDPQLSRSPLDPHVSHVFTGQQSPTSQLQCQGPWLGCGHKVDHHWLWTGEGFLGDWGSRVAIKTMLCPLLHSGVCLKSQEGCSPV